ncbi:hypothetical protein [Rhodococcus triatomae]
MSERQRSSGSFGHRQDSTDGAGSVDRDPPVGQPVSGGRDARTTP